MHNLLLRCSIAKAILRRIRLGGVSLQGPLPFLGVSSLHLAAPSRRGPFLFGGVLRSRRLNEGGSGTDQIPQRAGDSSANFRKARTAFHPFFVEVEPRD